MEDRISSDLEAEYPNLVSEGYIARSPKTLFEDLTCDHYNCLAFAAGVNDSWWEPDDSGLSAWPISKREYSLECYTEAYQSIGYEICTDTGIEEGFEKIVIYVLKGIPTHAAKQLPDGRWKSKLGQQEDIEHNTVKALEGDAWYGTGDRYMKRPIQNA